MTKQELCDLINRVEEDLENNPEKARIVNAEMETMKMEYPEFFDRVWDLTLGELSKSDIKKAFDLMKDYHVRHSNAN